MLKIIKKALHLEVLLSVIFIIGLVFNSSITLDAVEVYVDGQKIQEEFSGYSQREIEENLKKDNIGLESGEYLVLNPLDTDSAVKDDVITITTQKEVAIKINNEIKNIKTYALTVAELKNEMNLSDINTNYDDTKLLKDISATNEIIEFEHEIDTYSFKEFISKNTKYVDDPNLYVGQEVVEVEGEDGYNLYQTEKINQNGKIVEENTKLLTTKNPVSRVIRVGTKEVKHSVDWDSVALCESTGNWSIDTGNGYYGGLQIEKGTWDAHAPAAGVSAEYPNQATKDEQILVAESILSSQGKGAWGNCI